MGSITPGCGIISYPPRSITHVLDESVILSLFPCLAGFPRYLSSRLLLLPY
jgi:hypothetical protein